MPYFRAGMPYTLVSVGAPDRVHVRLAELVAALSLGIDLGFGHVDSTPMLKGLPGDRCTCPHWGYVFKGRVTYTFDGREEVHEAGDAFYVPGGHLQRADAGTEYLQISPAAELRTVSETIMRNMRELMQSAGAVDGGDRA